MRSIIVTVLTLCCTQLLYSKSYNDVIPELLKDYFLNAQIDLSLPGYDYHDTYYSGYNLIRVCKNGKWGLVNRDAEVIAPCKYDNLSERFEEGLMWAVLNGKVGYINEKGETIIPFEYINNYSNISDDKDFYCGLACVCINPDERVLINHKGERVTPSSKHYKDISIYQHHANGIWIAFTKHKTVFLDIYGKEYKHGKYSTSQSTYSSQQAICDKIKSMALNGDPVAQYNLGIMYTRGASMFNYNVNKGNATTFLRKSAKQGFKPAQLYLSKLLYSVKDTTFNEEAYLWYKEYSGMKINPSDISPASIIWLVYEPTTRQKDYSFKIGVKSDSKIEDVSVYINGVLTRGIIPVHNDGYNMTIDRTVTLNDGQNSIKVTVKNAGGIATTEKTVIYQNQSIATIDWLAFSPTTTEKQFALKAGIKSTSKIESWTVSVNGVVDRGINPVKNDGYDLTIDKMLTLSEGNNTVKIEVRNAGGIAMAEKSVAYSPKKQTPLVQQKRIALVMGNANYRDIDKRLKNPANDATDIAAKLESLGFTVIRSLDQTQQGMEAAINNFGTQARNYDVALFYYAGHGVRCNGSNYLIPIDANLPEESYVQYKCTNANLVLDLMDKAHCQMKIVILDACRNNPFARSWTRSTDGGGLNIMNAPKGTFIAFSTAPGDVAQDGTERNSPYTAALLQTLDVPNLSITDFFQEVLERVALKTNDRQTPWTSNSFRGNFIFNQK